MKNIRTYRKAQLKLFKALNLKPSDLNLEDASGMDTSRTALLPYPILPDPQ